MRTVQERWKSYKDEVLPKDASDIQVSECRTAFYAGASTMLKDLTLGKEEMSDNAIIGIIEGYWEEVNTFYDQKMSEAS